MVIVGRVLEEVDCRLVDVERSLWLQIRGLVFDTWNLFSYNVATAPQSTVSPTLKGQMVC